MNIVSGEYCVWKLAIIESNEDAIMNPTVVILALTSSLLVTVSLSLQPSHATPMAGTCTMIAARGMCDAAIQTIFRSVIIAKLTSAASAWRGFTKASDRQRIDALIRRSKRHG